MLCWCSSRSQLGCWRNWFPTGSTGSHPIMSQLLMFRACAEPQLWLLGLLALVQAADEIVISSVRELGNTWLLFQIRVSQVSNCSLKYKALAWKLQVSGTPFFDLYCLIQGCGSTADNLSVLPFSSTVLVSSWHRVV